MLISSGFLKTKEELVEEAEIEKQEKEDIENSRRSQINMEDYIITAKSGESLEAKKDFGKKKEVAQVDAFEI